MAGPLAQKLKAKYPQYRNIPDDELERQVIAKYPQYKTLAEETPNTPPTFGSRLYESGVNTIKGVGSMLSTASRLASPTSLLVDSIRNRPRLEETMSQGRDLAAGAVAPITGAYKGAKEGGVSGAASGFGSGLLEVLGADPNAVKEDWRSGNYGALAGDLAIPAAMTATGAGLARRGIRGKSLPKPILDDLPMPPAPPDLPFPPSRQLPAIGETYSPPRFTAHPSGKVADSLVPDTPEALRSLDLEPPTTDIVDARRSADSLRAGSRANIEPPIREQWDFDKPNPVPDPLSYRTYESPGVAGIGNVSTKGKTKGEFTRRDYISDKGDIFSTVPDRLRPEPTNVGQFKGAANRITPEPPTIPKEAKTVTIGEGLKGKVKNPEMDLPESLLPSAPPKGSISRFRKKSEPIVKEIETVAKDAGLPVKSPTIRGIIKERINNSAWKKEYDKVFTSPTRQFENMGEGGKKVATAIKDANTAYRSLGGKYDAEFSSAFKDLSKAEKSEAIRLLDGKLSVAEATSQKAIGAYQKARKALDELGTEAEKVGVSGQFGDFKKMEGEYFPHEFEHGKFPKEELRKILIEEGKSLTEVNAILDNPRKFKEFTLSYQKGRFKNLPGYLETPDVLTRYAYDMAKKIEYTKRFGARDIADPNSPISQMLKNTEDVGRGSKILEDYFGRGVRHDESSTKVARAITKFEVATKLSLSAINQIADISLLPVKTSWTDFIKGTKQVLMDAAGSKDLAMKGGNLEILRNEALYELGSGTKFGKIYGLTPVESKLRTIQAVVGRTHAQTLFNELKSNPTNATLRKRLGDFLEGRDIDSVLKQDKLTPQQLDFASGRMSELSAGVPDKASLPKAFSSANPMLKLPLLFQRFAFLTTKNLKDAIMSEPTYKGKIAKTVSALAAYQISGEIAGDLREIAKGLVDNVIGGKGIEKRVGSRGKEQWYSTGDDTVDRMIANSLQSWFFGFLGDKIESAGRGTSGYTRGQNFLGNLAGPVGGDIKDFVSIVTDPSIKNLKSQGVKRIPFVGSAINEKMREDSKIKPSSPFK